MGLTRVQPWPGRQKHAEMKICILETRMAKIGGEKPGYFRVKKMG